MLDIYCERAGAAGFWAEPVNALTNLAFIGAAVAIGLRLGRAPSVGRHKDWDLWLLTLLLAAIGVGSGLWHTVATSWALLADVLPITLFINLYLLSFGWRMLGLRWPGLPLLWLGYQVLSFGLLALLSAEALNGSVGYLPALACLLGFAGWLRLKRHSAWRAMATAALLFTVSVSFRTLDAAICSMLAVGTHFLWHLLNAALLFLLLRILLDNRGPAAGVKAPRAGRGRAGDPATGESGDA